MFWSWIVQSVDFIDNVCSWMIQSVELASTFEPWWPHLQNCLQRSLPEIPGCRPVVMFCFCRPSSNASHATPRVVSSRHGLLNLIMFIKRLTCPPITSKQQSNLETKTKIRPHTWIDRFGGSATDSSVEYGQPINTFFHCIHIQNPLVKQLPNDRQH